MHPKNKLLVLGAGAFGKAMAMTASRSNAQKPVHERVAIFLWARREEVRASWQKEYGRLYADVHLVENLADTLSADPALIYALPVQVFRDFFTAHKVLLNSDKPLLITSKGIEASTGAFFQDILKSFGNVRPFACLGGPHLAKELFNNSPTCGLLGGEPCATRWFKQNLSHPSFPLDHTTDCVGVMLASALKNVMALLSGVMQGEGLAENTRYAFLAKGFAEIEALGKHFGADPKTFSHPGLLADYMLTTGSMNSRNTKAGIALGKGKSLADVSSEELAEGLLTLKALVYRLDQDGVTDQFLFWKSCYQSVYENKSIKGL